MMLSPYPELDAFFEKIAPHVDALTDDERVRFAKELRALETGDLVKVWVDKNKVHADVTDKVKRICRQYGVLAQ